MRQGNRADRCAAVLVCRVRLGLAALLAVLGAGSRCWAAEQGALGATSQAAIRIEVSVAPRISFRSLIETDATATAQRRVVLHCVYLNSGVGAFALVSAMRGPSGPTDRPGAGPVLETVAPTPTPGDCLRGRSASWIIPREPGKLVPAVHHVLLLAAQ